MVELPVGGVVRKKNNPNSRQAEMARLTQLGDILGMDQAQIMSAQSDLAEQAYKAQVCVGGEVWEGMEGECTVGGEQGTDVYGGERSNSYAFAVAGNNPLSDSIPHTCCTGHGCDAQWPHDPGEESIP